MLIMQRSLNNFFYWILLKTVVRYFGDSINENSFCKTTYF